MNVAAPPTRRELRRLRGQIRMAQRSPVILGSTLAAMKLRYRALVDQRVAADLERARAVVVLPPATSARARLRSLLAAALTFVAVVAMGAALAVTGPAAAAVASVAGLVGLGVAGGLSDGTLGGAVARRAVRPVRAFTRWASPAREFADLSGAGRRMEGPARTVRTPVPELATIGSAGDHMATTRVVRQPSGRVHIVGRPSVSVGVLPTGSVPVASTVDHHGPVITSIDLAATGTSEAPSPSSIDADEGAPPSPTRGAAPVAPTPSVTASGAVSTPTTEPRPAGPAASRPMPPELIGHAVGFIAPLNAATVPPEVQAMLQELQRDPSPRPPQVDRAVANPGLAAIADGIGDGQPASLERGPHVTGPVGAATTEAVTQTAPSGRSRRLIVDDGDDQPF